MPMIEPEWGAPPPRKRGRGVRVNKMALKLAARKGEWAKIGVYEGSWSAHARASRIRKGRIQGFASVGRFEADVRPTHEGYAVWVKCVAHSKAYTNGWDSGIKAYWEVEDDDNVEDQ